MSQVVKSNRGNILARIKYYKEDAIIRKVKFELTEEECRNICLSPCAYCGSKKKTNNIGLNRLGDDYTEESCNAICNICQSMKKLLDIDVFILRCTHILTKMGAAHGKLHPELFPDHISDDWASHENRAKVLTQLFKLTKNEFNEVVAKPCHYCGKCNSETHQNGVTMLINKNGYVYNNRVRGANNCIACCNECASMKSDLKDGIFVNQMTKIYNRCKKLINNGEIVAGGEDNIYCNPF